MLAFCNSSSSESFKRRSCTATEGQDTRDFEGPHVASIWRVMAEEGRGWRQGQLGLRQGGEGEEGNGGCGVRGGRRGGGMRLPSRAPRPLPAPPPRPPGGGGRAPAPPVSPALPAAANGAEQRVRANADEPRRPKKEKGGWYLGLLVLELLLQRPQLTLELLSSMGLPVTCSAGLMGQVRSLRLQKAWPSQSAPGLPPLPPPSPPPGRLPCLRLHVERSL